MVARSSVEEVTCQHDEVDGDGEKILLEKVTSHFKKQMEHHPNSISQMVYNTGRLGGEI